LINARGEVIGINAAISSRASNIGFAVPINGATAILPQLRAHGRVSRGFLGVTLLDVDGDLDRSLSLGVRHGALVQDLTTGEAAERAGLKPYDVIVGLDEATVGNEDQLIREIAGRAPGSAARLRFVRDGREQTVTVKLGERHARATTPDRRGDGAAPPSGKNDRTDADAPLGLSLKELDRATMDRMLLPKDMSGVLITRVEPISSSFDGGVERGSVLMEINRQRIASIADVKRIARAARPGDVLSLYVFVPDLPQRQLKTVHVEDR